MNSTQAYATIFGCARTLGMDKEAVSDLAERLTTQRRLSKLTDEQRVMLAKNLRDRTPNKSGKMAREERADLRQILVLWWRLADAGIVAVGAKDTPARRKALNAFIGGEKFQAKWGEALTEVRFLSAARARDVIEALKAIGKRNKVETIR